MSELFFIHGIYGIYDVCVKVATRLKLLTGSLLLQRIPNARGRLSVSASRFNMCEAMQY